MMILLDYEKFKKWFIENKPKIVIGVCFVLVFIIGFGTGRYDKESASRRAKANNNQKYYNTDSGIKPKVGAVGETTDENKVLPASTATQCLIKGNISTKGKKIYHVPSGAFYNQVKPEQCFANEEQARAAGYVKSSR